MLETLDISVFYAMAFYVNRLLAEIVYNFIDKEQQVCTVS